MAFEDPYDRYKIKKAADDYLKTISRAEKKMTTFYKSKGINTADLSEESL